MREEDLDRMTIAGAGRAIRAGTLSPVALTEATLAHRRLQPRLNASSPSPPTSPATGARGRGGDCCRALAGPLHGVPISLKDLYCTRGVRTTAGSTILADYVPA
jgi:aspartyl-tRNA(Asn)/glutamyl-tRNA(Gln) amidotransferase subunit A